jgi:hypothetical protein
MKIKTLGISLGLLVFQNLKAESGSCMSKVECQRGVTASCRAVGGTMSSEHEGNTGDCGTTSNNKSLYCKTVSKDTFGNPMETTINYVCCDANNNALAVSEKDENLCDHN